MEVENVAFTLAWLDEAFAKGVVDDLEASCCLAGYSENEVRINNQIGSIHELYPVDIHHTIVSKIYGIIMSLDNRTRRKPLLWYIEQAVVRSIPYVRYDLLLPKCKETEYRQKECIDNYPALARHLGLKDTLVVTENDAEQVEQPPALDTPNPGLSAMLVGQPWMPAAQVIWIEKRKGNQKLSQEQIAEKVHQEMYKRHAAGELGMTKRGGKKVPDPKTILRHLRKHSGIA